MVGSKWQQQVEVVGIGLQVGVDVTGIGRIAVVEAGLQGGAQALVLREMDKKEVRVPAADFFQQGASAVGGAIVDKEHAGGLFHRFFEVGGEPLFQLGQVVPFVEKRDDNGETIGCGGVHRYKVKKLFLVN